jgi:RHH-type transcriptional regulator, rel operon repressor / antitoxin RelB
MTQITARIPDDLVATLDDAARTLKRTRADVVRQALTAYLEDYEDLQDAMAVLADPNDTELDWEEVRAELFHKD